MEYNNSQTEEKKINNSELEKIKSYCQQKGVSTLNLSDLQSNQQQDSKGFNWKSPWVIGISIVLLVGMVGLVLYFTRKNKE